MCLGSYMGFRLLVVVLIGASRMSVYENQLTKVPPEIGNMANLQEL